jgi:hypothetical protein
MKGMGNRPWRSLGPFTRIPSNNMIGWLVALYSLEGMACVACPGICLVDTSCLTLHGRPNMLTTSQTSVGQQAIQIATYLSNHVVLHVCAMIASSHLWHLTTDHVQRSGLNGSIGDICLPLAGPEQPAPFQQYVSSMSICNCACDMAMEWQHHGYVQTKACHALQREAIHEQQQLTARSTNSRCCQSATHQGI